jgi:hypothetical protein
MDASSAIESIDEDSTAHRNSVHQRLRANSTIMQVKKLLGKLSLLAVHLCLPVYLLSFCLLELWIM